MAVKRIFENRLEKVSIPREPSTPTNVYFDTALKYRIWVDSIQPTGEGLLPGDIWRNTSTNPHSWYQLMPNNTWVSIDAGTLVNGQKQNGLMTASDKTKLDGIEANANNYVHPDGNGTKHIPVGGVGAPATQVLVNSGLPGEAMWADLTSIMRIENFRFENFDNTYFKSFNTIYYNDSSTLSFVAITVVPNVYNSVRLETTIDTVFWYKLGYANIIGTTYQLFGIIPPGWKFRLTGGGQILSWVTTTINHF